MSTVALQELIDTHDIVSVGDGFAVMTPRVHKLAEPSFVEFGSTGRSNYGDFMLDEYNPELRGREGYEKFDKMRRSDAQVRGTLRIVKTPVLAARWFMEPASLKKRDKKIAEQIWRNLVSSMTVSFPQLMTEMLLFLDYGNYIFEKVWEIKDGMVQWRKWAPRHPIDVYEWEYDSHGGPRGAWFYNYSGMNAGEIFIPIEKLLVFTFDKEAGSMEGISVLRSAYKHWYFKENLYKIDAIQKERHGIGIPVIKLPPNFTPADKAAAEQLGRNLRTNEKAHIVLPPMWEVLFAKIEGQPVNCLDSIEHHNQMIAQNILAPFFSNPEAQGQEEQQQFFLKGTRFVAEIIRDVINKWAIPEWIAYNYPGVVDYPQLRARRIGDNVDWRQLSFALRNLIGAGVIRPDDKLEEWIRDEMDLPAFDVESMRQITPKQVPQAQLPQQAPAGNMDQAKTPGNTGRVGLDGGGAR